MFKKFTNGCVRVVNRWLPDAFLFAIILSIIVFIGSMCATKMGAAGAQRLGRFQGLLGSAEFLHADGLVLVFGSAMAAAKPCKRPCSRRRSVPQQYAGHRGHHLHLHHLLLAELGLRPDRRHPAGQGSGAPGPHRGLSPADCLRLFGLRHLARGLSGSIPLDLVAGKDFGGVAYQAPITDTVFHPMNLIMVGVILFAMPFVNYAMHPDKNTLSASTPLCWRTRPSAPMRSRLPPTRWSTPRFCGITLVGGFVYIVYYFVQNGFTLA